MKITLLNENSSGRSNSKLCLAEWGLSLYIQINGIQILFDTGHTNVYQHNAKQLGIDLNKTNFILLSHYHWDHTGGLRYHTFQTKKKIIFHPDILKKLPSDELHKVRNDFDIITSSKPLEFSKNIFYLGQIPRKNNFEKGMYQNDSMNDDSAIAIKTEKGAVVISGCSHSGICNICEYAKEITGQKLYAVLGGFHLFEDQLDIIEKTVSYFKNESPKLLLPMHCVDHVAMTYFYNTFKNQKYASGDSIEIDI